MAQSRREFSVPVKGVACHLFAEVESKGVKISRVVACK